jgi:hypothetical protein
MVIRLRVFVEGSRKQARARLLQSGVDEVQGA